MNREEPPLPTSSLVVWKAGRGGSCVPTKTTAEETLTSSMSRIKDQAGNTDFPSQRAGLIPYLC